MTRRISRESIDEFLGTEEAEVFQLNAGQLLSEDGRVDFELQQVRVRGGRS